jgi:hypothetical protein
MTGITDLWAFGLVTLVWFVYAAYVIREIRVSGQYEDKQLKLQTLLAFAIPILGALFVHFMFLATQSKEPKPDRHHVRQEHEADGPLFGRNKQTEDE